MSKVKKEIVKGFKVTKNNMTCRGFQYELGKEYSISGDIYLCNRGFHFCLKAQHCFNYYDFDTQNRVFEIEASGDIEHGDDKSVASEIKLIREISWQEVLTIVNTGVANTGHSNSGDFNSGNSNSGNSNSGDSNSGDFNSGDFNSGDSNSGYSNSGDSNSGYRNSGDSNSGNRNSGDSNSGYRNSGAFCTEKDPVLYLFDKPTNIKVREWESGEVVKIMDRIDLTIWVPASIMSDEEKAAHPKWETTEGYLKTLSTHEAWANLWNNLNDDTKKQFTNLPNFDANKFKEITGITA